MYKPISALVLTLLFIFSVQHADAATPPYKTVQSTHLKASAKSGAKTLQTLKANTRLTVISKTSTWAYVQTGKTKGYVTTASIISDEVPIKQFDYNEVMTYKGTAIVSLNGKSVKIDPALLPLFKQNADALRSTLVKPKIKNNTLVGFEKLILGQFAPVSKPFVIDRNAAGRIDSLQVPGRHVTVTTAAPLRQVIFNGSPYSAPSEDELLSVTLNGPVQQFHSNGAFTLKGKGTIERWDINKAQHSFELPVMYNGEIGFLNVKHADILVRGTNTFKVRAVSAPTKTHILDGPNGLLGSTKPAVVLQGKRMGTDEKAVAMALQNVTATKLTQLFKQLNIAHTSNHINDYVKAFASNETAGPNEMFFATKADVQYVVSTVDRVLTFDQFSEPLVALSNQSNLIQIQTENKPHGSWSYPIYHKRAVNALIGELGLMAITFKGPDVISTEIARNEQDGHYFIYDHPHGLGTFRVVTIDGATIDGFTYEVEMGRLSYSEYSHIDQEELVRIGSKTLDAYNQAPPAFEVKVVKGMRGSSSYLAVRSSDKRWLERVYGYEFQVNKNYWAGGRLSSDEVDLAGWDPKQTIVLSQLDAKLNDSLTIQAFGYQDATQK
ncbi:hypothetical protein A6395_05005 [Exiguobacterium sp. SH31]|uniref:hypothetical protein n=1 Tax=Exiguobacterium sp. SH31 TaxID=1843183 RepID=UPI0008C8F20A|nr:hypothetical protein [Exiguobacterium sp. SH31]OGX79958.1 hypothetical protein A6395_05005 [Exiguobacterium sp. SH31]